MKKESFFWRALNSIFNPSKLVPLSKTGKGTTQSTTKQYEMCGWCGKEPKRSPFSFFCKKCANDL